MRRSLTNLLDRTSTIYMAAALSLAIGLFFTFVWAPHPWGWQGIDQYHGLALALAQGEPFATTDVPWGYAYFAAFFYWLLGTQVWIPVTAQVLINAAAPILVHHLVRPMVSQRVAVLSALLTGVLSFNNVYASTQTSDAVCTILFLAALWTLTRAITTSHLAWFAVSGLLSGIVPQFRPNLVLLPALFAVGYFLYHRTARHLRDMVVYSALVIMALTPWIVRNYQLTGLFLPTSTHGGVQLWYGTLQVGPYLESRAHNPRAIFESAPFRYTSLADTPLLVDVDGYTCVPPTPPPTLVYWTDRDPKQTSIGPQSTSGRHHRYVVPGQPAPTAVYYYFQAPRSADGPITLIDPPGGASNPYVFLVDDAHLRNLDRHNDVLDVFDLIVLARHLAWREPAEGSHLDLNGDGAISQHDLDRALTLLLPNVPGSRLLDRLAVDNDRVSIVLNDGSTVSVPAQWSGLHTDREVNGNLAGAVISRWRTFSSLRATRTHAPDGCELVEEARINDQFYRREPHLMRRYMALALDNISRDPWAFAAASAYRAVRLFVIRGSADPATAQQFSSGRIAYTAGTVLSATYLLVFLAGAWIAWRRRSTLLWLLVPIVYVPLTICFVLTNMRYTVTMQPLMFVFVALAIVTALRLDSPSGEQRADQGRGAP
jgi:hypothetical protein